MTNVWIDDLEVAGYVGAAPSVRGGPRPPSADAILPVSLPVVHHGSLDPHAGPGVRLSNSVLLADGEPIFPRVIQYRGEPLLLLKQLGFNAIWTAELPSPQVRDGVAAAGDVAGLPAARAACRTPRRRRAGRFGPEFQQVLAWDLGGDLIGAQLAGVRRWAEQVRAADPGSTAPCSARRQTICGATAARSICC